MASSTANKVIAITAYIASYFESVIGSIGGGGFVPFFSIDSIEANDLQDDVLETVGGQSTFSESNIYSEFYYAAGFQREFSLRHVTREGLYQVAKNALENEVPKNLSQATYRGQVIDTKTPTQQGVLS